MPLSSLFLPMAREMYNSCSLLTVHCSLLTVHCLPFTEFIWLFPLKIVSLQKSAFRFYYQRAEKPYNS